MKVLFVIDSLQIGGTEKSILNLINNFSDTFEIHVCYFYNQHDLRNDYEKASCRLKSFNLKGKYSLPSGVLQLRNYVLENNIDIMISSLYRSSVISRLTSIISGVPLIDTIVNDSYSRAKMKEFKGVNIYKYLFVFIFDFLTSFIPKYWIGNSIYISNKLSKQLLIDRNKIKVLYRGRNINEISEWTRPNNTNFRFIAIGRLFPQKAHDVLIESFAKLNHKFPNIELQIIGDGPSKIQLEKLVKKLNIQNNVFFDGKLNNAWLQLYFANCFILPSRYEGFSGALVEALISGIPVICSDIPMNKEAVSDNLNGFVFKVNDINHLLDKMEEVITNYDSAILRGKNARSHAILTYDLAKITSEYESFLIECVKRDRKK